MQKLFCVLFILYAAVFSAAETVTVKATAQGDFAAAREQALTNALHDAVRQGAGVDVISQSEVRDLALVEDVVFSRSLGYLESYKIRSQNYDAATQIYSIEIQAEVSKKPLTEDQSMAIKLLLKRLKSPVAMVYAKEDIDGVRSKRTITDGILREMAQDMGIQIVDQRIVQQQNQADAARAEAASARELTAVKIAAQTGPVCDFHILAEVTGEISALHEIADGVQVRDASFDVALKAVWADTGETIAYMTIPPAVFNRGYDFKMPFSMPRQLASVYLARVLRGEKGFEQANAGLFYRKLLRKWITELDLGTNVQLRFLGASHAMTTKMIQELNRTSGISQVRLRSIDSRFYTVLEVETKLDYQVLAQTVLRIGGSRYQVETATPRRLTFEIRK